MAGQWDDVNIPCGGFGTTKIVDNTGEKRAFYVTPIVGDDPKFPMGFQLGCCGTQAVCWVAVFEYECRKKLGSNQRTFTMTHRVAVTPCDDHCRIPGPYENAQPWPALYYTQRRTPPTEQSFRWEGDGSANSLTVIHFLETDNLVCTAVGAPAGFDILVADHGIGTARIYTGDGRPIPDGTVVVVTLREGIREERVFTWTGDGLSSEQIYAHNLGSTEVNVFIDIRRFPSGDPFIPAILTEKPTADTVRVYAQDLGLSPINLEYGFEVRVTVVKVRPLDPGEIPPVEGSLPGRRGTHWQFTWGGIKQYTAASSISDSHSAGVQIGGVYFGQQGWFSTTLDGRRARVMIADGMLSGMTYGKNWLQWTGGGADPVLNWEDVTECRWEAGADDITGVYPEDSDGILLPMRITEDTHGSDYFFTLPVDRAVAVICWWVSEGAGFNPITGQYYDELAMTYYHTNRDNVYDNWHGRFNFEYKASSGSDAWLRSNMPTIEVAGSIYKLDQEMVDYIANDGRSWSGTTNQSATVPPLPASKILLPTWPNGLPEEETDDLTATADFRAWRLWKDDPENNEWVSTPFDATSPIYPEIDDITPVSEELRAYWRDRGLTVSDWYTHPQYIEPDAISEVTSRTEGVKPFFDGNTLECGGANTEVLSCKLIRWEQCDPDHMCIRKRIPERSFTPIVPFCHSTQGWEEVFYMGQGGAVSGVIPKWPHPLRSNMTALWPKKPRSQTFTWTGDGIRDTYNCQHNYGTSLPNVSFGGASVSLLWYAVDDNNIVVYTANLQPLPFGYTVRIKVREY